MSTAAVLRMIPGLHISRAVYGASKLGISDLLADGPRPSAELAHLTKAHAPFLYRVLRLPAALNLLWEQPPGLCAHPARGAAADRRSGIPSQLGDVDRPTRRTAAFRSHPILGDSHTILAATALLTHFGAPGSAIG